MTGINVQEALARFDNDKDIYLELIETYLDMGRPDFIGMKIQLNAGERNTVMQQIHKLKGGALTLGADEFGKLANKLELALRSGTGKDSAELLAIAEKTWDEMSVKLMDIRDQLRKST